MRLWTIQISKWRLASERNIRFMDTTVKSGYSLFAPTWDMVLAHKRGPNAEGGMSDERYSELYRTLLINSWQARRQEWMNFLEDDEMYALACYCAAGKFCHRLLLVRFLKQLCRQLQIPFEYYGELIDDASSKETLHVHHSNQTSPCDCKNTEDTEGQTACRRIHSSSHSSD